jgi:hypothetical protein
MSTMIYINAKKLSCDIDKYSVARSNIKHFEIDLE